MPPRGEVPIKSLFPTLPFLIVNVMGKGKEHKSSVYQTVLTWFFTPTQTSSSLGGGEKPPKPFFGTTPAKFPGLSFSGRFFSVTSLLSFPPLPCPDLSTALYYCLCCLLPAGLRRQTPCWHHCLLCPASHQPQPQP